MVGLLVGKTSSVFLPSYLRCYTSKRFAKKFLKTLSVFFNQYYLLRFKTSGFRKQDPSFATKSIHSELDPSQWPDGNPVVLPISLSTTFKQEAPGRFVVNWSRHSRGGATWIQFKPMLITQSCEYSRLGNPTRNTVERVVASLEGAKYGLAYASGMAAISTVMNLLSAGDHIVSSLDLYGGTSIYLKQVADRFNIKTTFLSDVADPANIDKAIRDNTRVSEDWANDVH